MIVRVAQRKRFTVVDNVTVEDDRLSWRAFGVLVYLLSRPDNWEASYRHLATLRGDGQHAIRMVLKELEEFGYLERRREQIEGGRFRWVQMIYETPCGDSPRLVDQRAVDHDMVDQRAESERVTSTGGASTEVATTDEEGDVEPSLVAWQIPGAASRVADALPLCALLAEQLEERGYSVNGQATSKRWVLDMEQLIRLDEREPDAIRRVLCWLHAGSDEVSGFWRTNVRSPRKLREKWQTMAEQYVRTKKPKAGRGQDFGMDRADVERIMQNARNGNGNSPPPSSALSLPSGAIREVV